MRLTARLCALVITFFAGFSANQVIAQAQVTAGQVIISELRFRGPNGTRDEFIEIYNNTNSPITVQATDATSGWAVSASSPDGGVRANVCLIPNGTVIPARGYFLCANAIPETDGGYSLTQYPSGTQPAPCASSTPNGTFQVALLPPQFGPTTPNAIFLFDDLPDGFGVALFTTLSIPNQSAASRLDAFGFTVSPALYREGAGFPTVAPANTEHTIYRNLSAEIPKDTNDNAADFLLVSTMATLQTSHNGAPGPQNLCGPTVKNSTFGVGLVAPSAGTSGVPNQERRAGEVGPNANLGTFYLRRSFTNNTGQPVSRLRFRIVNITTRGTPPSSCTFSNCADLRALTSIDETFVNPPVTVRGVRLEADPPITLEGGGMNSSLSADFIDLQNPLAPGATVNISFRFGLMKGGFFRFYINIEAANLPVFPD